MASTTAIITVPSQGKHADMFRSVAKILNRTTYHGHAKVVSITVTVPASRMSEPAGPTTVDFFTLDGSAFSWSDEHDLSTVITISHGFSTDGPNLGYGLGDEHYQAWGTDHVTGALGDAGKEFWGQKVGKALKSSGKIILVGCFMGFGDYARNVARTAGVKVYASTGLFAAANEHTVLKHVGAIEHGKALKPMVEASP
jgi:hypothetical protein